MPEEGAFQARGELARGPLCTSNSAILLCWLWGVTVDGAGCSPGPVPPPAAGNMAEETPSPTGGDHWLRGSCAKTRTEQVTFSALTSH